jgi:hypothetical protein
MNRTKRVPSDPMNIDLLASGRIADVPLVPAWAVLHAPVESPLEAAFIAGSALNSLDEIARAQAPWLGAWRNRLALKAAGAVVRLMRRGEDEAGLRDAWYLRQPGDETGPAGDILHAFRKLAGRRPAFSGEDIVEAAQLLGLGWQACPAGLEDGLDAVLRAPAPAPIMAARAARVVMDADASAEPLAWWVADLALARRMGWSHGLPVMSGQIHAGALRLLPGGRRMRAGADGFEHAAFLALAAGAGDACRIAADIARRAALLAKAAPKLRSKGAGEVIGLLLADDAVPGTHASASVTRWASRRLFERLEGLGAVRELTGRPAFRLYGL